MKMKNGQNINKSFLIIMLLFMFIPSGIFSATYTICSSGCDYTSIQTAYNAAASGDTLELRANLAENLAMTSAKSCNITSQTGNRFTWDGANNGTSTLTVTSAGSVYPAWTISNIVMDHSSASGGYVIELVRGGSGDINPTLTITQSILMRTSTSTTNARIITNNGNWDGSATNQVTITRTEIIGTANCDGLWYGGGNNTHAYDLTNCILRGFTGTRRAIYDAGNNFGVNINAMNCTFFNNNEAYRASSSANNAGRYLTNCLFIGNTSDVANLSAGLKSVFTYCALSGSGYGTGCQYNPVAASEVIDPSTTGTPNLHLLSTAPKSLDLGTNSGAPAIDFDGVGRPYNTTTDIGAYEWTAGLNVSKSADVTFAYIGDTVQYCLTYTNTTSADKDTHIWDSVPAHMIYVSCDSGCDIVVDGSYTIVHWFLTIGAGYSGTVCFRAAVTGYPYFPSGKDYLATLRQKETDLFAKLNKSHVMNKLNYVFAGL